MQCDQGGDLVSLVAELKEEAERLRSIRECEREIDWWSRTVPSLGLRLHKKLHRKQRIPCHPATKHQEGKIRNGKRSLLGAAGESPPGLPHLPSCPCTTDMGLWNLRARQMRM